jgi:DNA uptake protein ComE-like DNA-binding protein
MMRTPATSRRASVMVVVLWTIAIAALVTSAIQLFAYRQAHLGREAVHRVQARWAARGGIEYSIAVMADHTREPFADDAFALIRDLEAVADENLEDATYTIRHHVERWEEELRGPMDEHSKVNLNGVGATGPDSGVLEAVMEDVTDDVIHEILDWTDENDTARMLGAEKDFYLSLPAPYEPRNGRFHSIAELELVAGVWPASMRGEDWNLNSRLDASEDDAGVSLPDDNADAVLTGGWAERLTAVSVSGGATDSGEDRIYLPDAELEDLMTRLELTEDKAQQLIDFGSQETAELEALLPNALTTEQQVNAMREAQGALRDDGDGESGGSSGGGGVPPGGGTGAPFFEREELKRIFAETTMHDPVQRLPGKVNLNTVSEYLLRDILGDNPMLVDEMLLMRDRGEGINSIVDLADIPDIDGQTLQALASLFDTRSNVYTICSRGRSLHSGLEVEIIAVVDRSTLPVRIIEYREQ